jgi:hypothetical protein
MEFRTKNSRKSISRNCMIWGFHDSETLRDDEKKKDSEPFNSES